MISISSLAGETNCYKYNDKIISGGWKYSMINEWNPELNERSIGPDENFNDSGTIRWENSSYYNVQSVGLKNNCFDPTDRTETVSSENYFNAGKNFISGNIDMVPSGILFIW